MTSRQQHNFGLWPVLLPWLRLMRLPTVFTAMADIFCGYLITHSVIARRLLSERDLGLLLLSSAGLYLAGMVLNDVFDVALDARERPERPIPSGRISRTHAAIFGFTLMATGITAAWFAGLNSFLVAVAIALSVLLYDALAKSTIAGPLVMGGCRGLNILLGASLAQPTFPVIDSPYVFAALGLMTYVIGVTIFARNEAGTASSSSMILGLTIAVAGICIDAILIQRFGHSETTRIAAWSMLALLSANVLFRGIRAMRLAQPRLTQKTVGLMLLCIIFIDAAVVFAVTGDSRLATVVAVLTIPALLMKRVVPMS